MKIRDGFVSNSSSSSFVVARSFLTEPEITRLLNYQTFSKDNQTDLWDIEIGPDYIEGWTAMDNGDFSEYLKDNDIPTNRFRFRGDW